MEWKLIKSSLYYKPTTLYSGKEYKILQTKKSKPFLTVFSSNEWKIIQESAYPVYSYDKPPDALMF